MKAQNISVIIVSWNACSYLRNCLVSIRETGGELVREIIVVDNASTDGAAEMVAKEFPEVVLIKTGENLGFARANNLGIKRASGSYLALVNSDVIVHQGCFQVLAQFLDENPNAGLVGPNILGGDGLLQRSCRRLPTVWNTTCRVLALDSVFSQSPFFSGREMRHWKHDNQAEVEVISGCFWLARRTAVDAVGGLDERFFFYAEDVDWCKRFGDAMWKVVFVPSASATHFGGASSNNAPLRFSVEMLRANVTYWKKYHGFMGQSCFYLLTLFHHTIRAALYGLRALVSTAKREDSSYKYRRSWACLRWLVFGKQHGVTVL
jgi:GT2 family glycosyltransferase